MDLIVAVPLTLIVSPILLAAAIAIKLDSPGPVLLAQQRTGRDGRRFTMIKFRTMVKDAEARKAELSHLNVLPPPDFKIPDDPRVTRVGRVLRKTSIDELPQLLNVIVGHMSLVGPRPTSFAATTYSLWHTRRLEVRPGITGLWQVTTRHSVGFDERLRLDISYIEHMSPQRDFRILAATALAVLRRSGV
jgi:lipopolysaccharide/colanic/teichoic acid biosynthesis glycosyltransferase